MWDGDSVRCGTAPPALNNSLLVKATEAYSWSLSCWQAHFKMHGIGSEIFLTIFLIPDIQLLLAESSYCHGPNGWVLHTTAENCLTAELYLTLKRPYCIIVIILTVSLTHPRFVSQSLSLFPPLFPYQGNSVVPCIAEIEEEFPFVYTRITFGSWKDLMQRDAVKKGKAYRRGNTGL